MIPKKRRVCQQKQNIFGKHPILKLIIINQKRKVITENKSYRPKYCTFQTVFPVAVSRPVQLTTVICLFRTNMSKLILCFLL